MLHDLFQAIKPGIRHLSNWTVNAYEHILVMYAKVIRCDTSKLRSQNESKNSLSNNKVAPSIDQFHCK